MMSAPRQPQASASTIVSLDIALRYHSSVGWNTWFRKRRMRRFARELGIDAETRVLDVGGTPETWDMLAVRPRVTLLNTPRTKAELARRRLVGGGRWPRAAVSR